MSHGKQRLRALLEHTGPRMGLGPAAVDELVRHAQMAHFRRHHQIFGAEDTSDLIDFLVSGAVKVTCPTGDGTVCVQMVRPGQFFGLNWYAERGQPRVFMASAFTDCTVAMVSSDTMARLVAGMPPRAVIELLTYSWRALSGLLYEKCCLLGLRLEDRLLDELGVLARDFGRRQADGSVIIDLPLRHADLGEFALGARANVARAMKRLERDGLVARLGRKIVLTPLFFAAGLSHVDRLRWKGWSVAEPAQRMPDAGRPGRRVA